MGEGTVELIIDELRTMGNPTDLAGMARYGISTERAFGIKMGDMQSIARRHKGDHKLALELWATGYREARLLTGMIGDYKQLDPATMNSMVRDFDSWDVCDSTVGKLFKKTTCAPEMALVWSAQEPLFVRRAGFATMAYLATLSIKLADAEYEPFLEKIVELADDDRPPVKKAVNWALRQIGKRNQALRRSALEAGKSILRLDSKSAHWIARDALRELNSAAVIDRLRARKE